MKRFNDSIKLWKKEYKLNYRFDRLIFNGALIIIFAYLFIAGYQEGFNLSKRIYIKCDSDMPCMNPFAMEKSEIFNPQIIEEKYNKDCIWDWCKEKYLEPGFEFGKLPGTLYNNAGIFATAIFSLAVMLNHFLHNRGIIDFKKVIKELE